MTRFIILITDLRTQLDKDRSRMVSDDNWANWKFERKIFKTFGCWVLFDLEARSLNKMTHWTYTITVPSPWVISKPHFQFREMISLFLLIFAFQNGLASGQVTLHDLQMTVSGMNDKINKLEAQVQDLQSEVKERIILDWFFWSQLSWWQFWAPSPTSVTNIGVVTTR